MKTTPSTKPKNLISFNNPITPTAVTTPSKKPSDKVNIYNKQSPSRGADLTPISNNYYINFLLNLNKNDNNTDNKDTLVFPKNILKSKRKSIDGFFVHRSQSNKNFLNCKFRNTNKTNNSNNVIHIKHQNSSGSIAHTINNLQSINIKKKTKSQRHSIVKIPHKYIKTSKSGRDVNQNKNKYKLSIDNENDDKNLTPTYGIDKECKMNYQLQKVGSVNHKTMIPYFNRNVNVNGYSPPHQFDLQSKDVKKNKLSNNNNNKHKIYIEQVDTVNDGDKAKTNDNNIINVYKSSNNTESNLGNKLIKTKSFWSCLPFCCK